MHRIPVRLVLLVVVLAPTLVLAASADLPERTDSNLIVASYNIQFMGERHHDLDKLAQVIRHFDVCGILEVKSEFEITALTEALETLTNEDWGYVFGIRTHRPQGAYHEAFAAVWRRDRVQLGDGLVSNVWDLEEAFRNDPFLVSFQRGGFDFTLLLVHTRWSDDDEGSRENEVYMLAEHLLWMKEFLPECDFILAGDFNYSGETDTMREMAEACGFTQIDPNDKTTFKMDYSDYASPYDHMYLNPAETVEYVQDSCRIMDTTRIIYGDNGVEQMRLSKRELSDHLPVWAVFDVSGEDDD